MNSKEIASLLITLLNIEKEFLRTIENIKVSYIKICDCYHSISSHVSRQDKAESTFLHAKDLFSQVQEKETYLKQLQKEIYDTEIEKTTISNVASKHL